MVLDLGYVFSLGKKTQEGTDGTKSMSRKRMEVREKLKVQRV